MTLPRRILHPTDFSGHACRALTLALDHAARTDAEVLVLHVVSGGALQEPLEWNRTRYDDLSTQLRETLNGPLNGLPRALRERLAIRYELVQRARPHDAILAYARDHDIDLIVMGTQGRRGLSYLVLGSEAEQVVHRAPCPVLTARASEEHHGGPVAIRRILAPVDFSAHTAAALDQVKALADLYEADVVLLFIAEEHLAPFLSDTGLPRFTTLKMDEAMIARAGDVLQELGARLDPSIHAVTSYVRRKHVFHSTAQEILRCAEEEAIDLIVMSAHGHTEPGETTLSRITRSVMRTSPVPVLTLRGAEAPGARAHEASRSSRRAMHAPPRAQHRYRPSDAARQSARPAPEQSGS